MCFGAGGGGGGEKRGGEEKSHQLESFSISIMTLQTVLPLKNNRTTARSWHFHYDLQNNVPVLCLSLYITV